MADITIEGNDHGELARLSRDLQKQVEGQELNRQIVDGFHEILRSLNSQVDSAYGGGKHLRPALRRATFTDVKVRGDTVIGLIGVSGKRMPSEMGRIPVYWEGEARWRHPVFGNEATWVSQAPHPSFYQIMQANTSRIEAKLNDVVDKATSGLE